MARGDQLARQWKIFQTLVTSRYGKSVSALVKDLGCCQRTVYRDLSALEAAGFPIYTENANGKNIWCLLDSARNPMPIPFTLPELMALYFGSDVLKVLKGTVFYDSLESLLKKVKSSIPPESGKYLSRVEKSLHTRPGPYKNYGKFRNVIEKISDAVLQRRVVEITYYTMSRKKETQRKVAPYKIWFYNGGFYLIGHCRWRDGVRIFAVERIKKIHLTDDTFEVPEEFDVDEFMRGSFGVYQGKPVNVRILFSAGIAEYIKEKIWHETQKLHDNPDGSVLFEANVACTKEIKAWVMRWGAKAIVLEPEELRDEIRAETVEMLAVYATGMDRMEKTLIA
jgi:predicted DNA-binding transcriptional regulator YafY